MRCFGGKGQTAPRQPAAVLVLGGGGRQAGRRDALSEQHVLKTVFCWSKRARSVAAVRWAAPCSLTVLSCAHAESFVV